MDPKATVNSTTTKSAHNLGPTGKTLSKLELNREDSRCISSSPGPAPTPATSFTEEIALKTSSVLTQRTYEEELPAEVSGPGHLASSLNLAKLCICVVNVVCIFLDRQNLHLAFNLQYQDIFMGFA